MGTTTTPVAPIAVGAGVKADRRSLPKDPLVAGVARIHFAFAESEAAYEGAGGLLTKDIRIGQAPTSACFLNRIGQSTRNGAKETLAIVDDLLGGKRRRRVGSCRRRDGDGAGGGDGQKLSARDGPHCDILRGGQAQLCSYADA